MIFVEHGPPSCPRYGSPVGVVSDRISYTLAMIEAVEALEADFSASNATQTLHQIETSGLKVIIMTEMDCPALWHVQLAGVFSRGVIPPTYC